MQAWAAQELAYTDLGDPRRTRRLIQMVEDFAAQPGASVPQACGTRAKTKAAYRLWDDEYVTPDAIQASHRASTVERAERQGVVLAVQDTTELDYADHPHTTGLGPLENVWQNGLKIHSSLAVHPDGVPLGLLYQKRWVRDARRSRSPSTDGNAPRETKKVSAG